MSNEKDAATPGIPAIDRKYAVFSHTFIDPWTKDANGDDCEVTLSFRFAKPTKLQIQRLQDKAPKNPTQASRNLLLDTVHPDDKVRLEEVLGEYAGIMSSLSTALIKGVGISAELGK